MGLRNGDYEAVKKGFRQKSFLGIMERYIMQLYRKKNGPRNGKIQL